MFHRQFGAVNALLYAIDRAFGLDLKPIAWFSHFSTAFAANVATNVWLGFPFMMVVTLGALTAVPEDVLEAAEVDGATRWQRFRLVTLPLLRPTLLPAVVLGAIWTFNMFNVVFLVSGGEPDGTTDILVSRGVPLGLHAREPVRLRRRLRGAHLPPALRRRRASARAPSRRRPRRRREAGRLWQEKGERVTPLESVASHVLLVLAVAFALYPVLWVVSLAFSGDAPAWCREVLPFPHHAHAATPPAVVTTGARRRRLALRPAARQLARRLAGDGGGRA